jgi:hypothetical protein
MEEADLSMETEMFIKASGKMTRHTAKEYILKMMVRAILGNGSKISRMDLV